MKRVFLLLLLFTIWGCTGNNNEGTSQHNPPPSCLSFIVEGDLTCIESEETYALVQSGLSESPTLTLAQLTITVQGTLQIAKSADRVSIKVLEGSSVIGIDGWTRIIQIGSLLELEIIDGIPQRPNTEPRLMDAEDLDTVRLETLPRPIETPVPAEATPTATRSAESTESVEDIEILPSGTIHATSSLICEPRTDWGKTYIVEAGDVLELIAERFNTSILEISRANCLANPGRLSIGQVLRIPGDAPTLTPSAIAFRADVTTVAPGECTVLRWDIYNVQAIFIEDQETSNSDILRVCPEETSTYTLRVIYPDGSEATRTLTIGIADP